MNGIADSNGKVAKTAVQMARAASNAVNQELGIHSPSKVGERSGMYYGTGFINGIVCFKDKAYHAGADIAGSVNSGLSNAISKVLENINSDTDTSPTIRPILDLSDVESKTSRLNTLFSREMAISIGTEISSSRRLPNENQNDKTVNGNTYTFTQNNYSPKAISRAELYRQTKNQFSAMREGLA